MYKPIDFVISISGIHLVDATQDDGFSFKMKACGDALVKPWFWLFIGIGFFSFSEVSESYADSLATDDLQRIQGPGFQPVLLAFDQQENRLFVATPAQDSSGSVLLIFQNLNEASTSPRKIFSLPGIASGLSYHQQTKTLFMTNAGKGEVLIFDRFDPQKTKRPTRVLRKFNFPTGVEAESASQRLFVADAHPGAVLVFEKMDTVKGNERPSLTIGPETGLNGPFDLVSDANGRLYVSNFDGVLVFDLNDLDSRPQRLPFSKNTLARGLAFDPQSQKLYIAAPMRQSYFIYDGKFLKEIELDGIHGAFPFSIAIDSKQDRLYLAGTGARVGVIEGVNQRPSPNRGLLRKIDRWIRWDGATPSPPIHPKPHERPKPSENVPSVIHDAFNRLNLNQDPANDTVF